MKSSPAKISPVTPKTGAELIGTFGLTLLVSLSVMSIPEITPLIAAITLAVFVYTIGPISGCHINPAVTVGLWSVKKISSQEAVWYVVAQCLGAGLALLVAQALTGASPQPTVSDLPLVGLGELLGAAFLVFGISAVVHGKVSAGATGVTIGGSLFLGIMVAATVSNGVLNPAVALGIHSLSLVYVVGPILGGILGAQVYRWLVR